MGYYTDIIVEIENKEYVTCGNEDGFDEHVKEEIERLVDYYLIYKNYVKNWLNFLNAKMNYLSARDMKYKWEEGGASPGSDEYHFLTFHSDRISYSSYGRSGNEFNDKLNSKFIKNLKNNSLEFQDFLNRRFCLSKIWEKFKVPSCLSKWIKENYF